MKKFIAFATIAALVITVMVTVQNTKITHPALFGMGGHIHHTTTMTGGNEHPTAGVTAGHFHPTTVEVGGDFHPTAGVNSEIVYNF